MLVAAVALSALVTFARSDAKSAGFKAGDTCAYAPLPVGNSSYTSGAEIVDIRELDDRTGRAVGFVYYDDRAKRYLQASALMSVAFVQRLGLIFEPNAPTSRAIPYDGQPTGLNERTCRRDHVVSSYVIRNLDRELRAALFNDVDIIPPNEQRRYIDRWGLAKPFVHSEASP